MICNSTNEFEVLLLKDRFTTENHTSSGWADALLNGRFLGQNTHVVEIQLHHDKLVSIREDMGGITSIQFSGLLWKPSKLSLEMKKL
jgi:hypothetical protein